MQHTAYFLGSAMTLVSGCKSIRFRMRNTKCIFRELGTREYFWHRNPRFTVQRPRPRFFARRFPLSFSIECPLVPRSFARIFCAIHRAHACLVHKAKSDRRIEAINPHENYLFIPPDRAPHF